MDRVSEQIGHRVRILVGKPGLDGHSNGSEQIALRARDVGMEVVYQGIRLTPEQIAESACRRMSTSSASRSSPARTSNWCPKSSRLLAEQGIDVPVVAGGIIPPEDAARLREARRRRCLHAKGL